MCFHLTSTNDLAAWGENGLCISADTQSYYHPPRPPFSSYFLQFAHLTQLLLKQLYHEWKATTTPAAQIPQAPWNLHIRSIQPETNTKLQHLEQFTEEAEEL